MQPYFIPYIGYFQLLNAVDEFVIYDNIEYTKKGWINRNRMLVNGKDAYITLPLKKDSDYLFIRDRFIADSWSSEKNKLLNRIVQLYRIAPYFKTVYPVIENIILYEENNLFKFLMNSLELIKDYLQIPTPFVVSSTIPINFALKGKEKVIEICKSRGATVYINPIGGVQLYSKDYFKEQGLDLHFLKTSEFTYKQFNHDFVPFLSIMDVMMFNSKDEIKGCLNSYFTME